jgi:hypothetical protein
MMIDLFGDKIEYRFDYDQIEKDILRNSIKNDIIPISFKPTEKGVKMTYGKDCSLNVSGWYAIFKDNTLLYIGCSTTNISQRVGRFFKELVNKSRDDESHSCAEDYRKNYYDGSTNGFSLMYFEDTEERSLNELERVEKRLIRSLRPLLNKKK